jgi:hypothetical protein
MTESQRRTSLMKHPIPFGEMYRAGDTVYVYNKKFLKRPADVVRRVLELPSEIQTHDQTQTFREWADKYSLPVPTDKEGLYNYVVTIGDADLPTVWPTKTYMDKHQTLMPRVIDYYIPKVIYITGTGTICRFGHEKRIPKTSNRKGKLVSNCGKCAWLRHQGVDLASFKPTHCLKGHSLEGNRWLTYKDGTKRVTEHCVQCNNDKVISRSGYIPHN